MIILKQYSYYKSIKCNTIAIVTKYLYNYKYIHFPIQIRERADTTSVPLCCLTDHYYKCVG